MAASVPARLPIEVSVSGCSAPSTRRHRQPSPEQQRPVRHRPAAPAGRLAAWPGPIPGRELLRHRAIVVADTSQELIARTLGVLEGQDMLRVPDIRAKASAQAAGLGHLPRWLAEPEIAAGQPIKLVIYLPRTTQEPALAAEPEAAIGHHFAHQAREQETELSELRRLGRKELAVGLLVMLFATLVGVALTNAFPDSRFIETIEHSLIIFGWVALWRPIEILLYDRWPLIRARKLFQRLATAPVVVRPATAGR